MKKLLLLALVLTLSFALTACGEKEEEMKEIKEDVKMSLMPMAFSKESSVLVWIDPATNLMVLDAGSQAKADEVLTGLVKALEGFAVNLVHTQTSPAVAMAHWLGSKEFGWVHKSWWDYCNNKNWRNS